jgi:hypothetical protein
MTDRAVLMVGLDPALIHTAASTRRVFPDIDADVLYASRERTTTVLRNRGFDVDACLLDYGRTAEHTLRAQLGERRYDCVVIGPGIRLDPDLTPLLETAVNAVHQLAPQASICFNTTPADTTDAVARWFPNNDTDQHNP